MKKIIVRLSALVMVILLLTGCGSSKEKKEEVKENTNSKNEVVSKAKYESSELSLFEDFKDDNVNGTIKEMVGYFNPVFLTKNNKVYVYKTIKFEYFMDYKDDFKSIVDKTYKSDILFQKKDGSYSLYNITDKEKNYDFKSDNLLAATVDSLGTLRYFSLKDGDLYASYKESNGDGYENNKVVFKENSKVVPFSSISSAKLIDGNLMYIINSEGNILATQAAPYTLKNSESTIYINSGFLKSGRLTDVDRIYTNVDATEASAPYTLKSDTDNIYVLDGMLSNQKQIQLAIPDGYKTSDIKDVYRKNKELLLSLNNGNMYYVEDFTESTTFTKKEELSKLNSQNHIKTISKTTLYYLVLCDDGYIYRLKY